MNENKELPEHPEGYMETSDRAYRERGLNDYLRYVFRDSSDGWLAQRPKDMTPENAEKWSLRHLHGLEHFVLSDDGKSFKKDQAIFYDWDWEEPTVFGGVDGFFSPNARILDLGSGMGKAAKEINMKYQYKSIKCIGVDYRYHRERPIEAEHNLSGGHFDNLPFSPGVFDRLLSVETFPSWLPFSLDMAKRYFEEISRVSKNGAIWRGTLPRLDEVHHYHIKNEISEDDLIRLFVVCGWDLVIDRAKSSFMAKLTKNR